MKELNLFCDQPGCGSEASFFSLSSDCSKTKSCQGHLQEITKKGWAIYEIAAYYFIAKPEDAAEYYQRKAAMTTAGGNLEMLKTLGEQEAADALEAIDSHETACFGYLRQRFADIRLAVNAKYSALLQEFAEVQSSLNRFMDTKNEVLSDAAQEICRGIQGKPRFLGLEIEDMNDGIARAVMDCWTLSEDNMMAAIESAEVDIAEKSDFVPETLNLDPKIEAKFNLSLQRETAKSAASLSWLQRSWDLRQQWHIPYDFTIGLKLAPLLSQVCGKCAEAESILETCLEGTQSETARVELCAVAFHRGEYQTAANRAEELLQRSEKLSPEHLWTARFYLSHSYYLLKKEGELCSFSQWVDEVEAGSAVVQVLRLLVCALLMSALQRPESDVEKVRIRAHNIAVRSLFVSRFTACNLHFLALRCKDHKKAIMFHEKASVIYSATAPQSIDAAHNFSTLAVLFSEQLRWTEAESSHLRALDLYQSLSPQSLYAGNNYYNLAVMYLTQQQWEKAEKMHKKAQEVYEIAAAESVEAANNWGNMGILYKQMKRLGEAKDCYSRARAIYDKTAPRSVQAANNLYNIGVLNEAMEEHREAASAFASASSLFAENQSLALQAAAERGLNRNNGNCQIY